MSVNDDTAAPPVAVPVTAPTVGSVRPALCRTEPSKDVVSCY